LAEHRISQDESIKFTNNLNVISTASLLPQVLDLVGGIVDIVIITFHNLVASLCCLPRNLAQMQGARLASLKDSDEDFFAP